VTLNRNDMMAAVTQGVRQGIADMMDNEKHANLLVEAITKGVVEGWRATTSPAHWSEGVNFYHAIGKAVADTMEQRYRGKP